VSANAANQCQSTVPSGGSTLRVRPLGIHEIEEIVTHHPGGGFEGSQFLPKVFAEDVAVAETAQHRPEPVELAA